MRQQSTVFVVDADPNVREALNGLLQSVGLSSKSFASAEQFLQAPHPEGPCCLILDIHSPSGNGRFHTELRKIGLNIPVVLIAAYGDVPMAVQAIKDGAVDFLIKPFREQDLLDAVRAALDRDKVERDAYKWLLDLRARYDALTTREKMVMSLVCAGFMNKQIAEQLGIAEITVKVHRHNMMKKLNAGSLPELVRMGERLQIQE